MAAFILVSRLGKTNGQSRCPSKAGPWGTVQRQPYGNRTVAPLVSRASSARCASAASLSAKVWPTVTFTVPSFTTLNNA